MVCHPSVAYHQFLYSSQTKSSSYIILMVGEKIKRIMFCEVWKLYDNQISEFINRILLEHSHAH